MIATFTTDDEDNTVVEFDEEGIDYMICGLMDLSEASVGSEFTSSAVWTNPAPWWRIWNRKGTPVVGEVILRRVA